MTSVTYTESLNQLKQKIREAKNRAILSVNLELLSTYWEIGKAVLLQQESEEWGSKVVDRLARDLKLEFPDMKGLSVRNIKYMRAFAKAYPNFPFVQEGLAQSNQDNQALQHSEFVQEPLAQISWYHHITLLDKVKDEKTRLFYIFKTVENGWTRDMLVNQIESQAFNRQGIQTSNFDRTIAPHESELIRDLFKDEYAFNFLQLDEKARERDLENALLGQITNLLLELGDGFTFKGRQYRLEVGNQEYFIDLLFYHTKLRRYIVIELKIGDFKPEYAGKINFYLGLVDDRLKGEFDQPAIGLILCKTKNKIIAEYALRDTSKPIGIAEYTLGKVLPDDIKTELPSIAELEQKLDEEIKENFNTPDYRLKKLKEKLRSLHNEEIQIPATYPILVNLFENGLKPLYLELMEKLSVFDEYFLSKTVVWKAQNKNFQTLQQVEEFWKDENALRGIRDFYFEYNFYGFKKGGTQNFVTQNRLKFEINDYWYAVSYMNPSTPELLQKKLYHQTLSIEDREHIADFVINRTIDSIEWMVNNIVAQ